MEMTSESETERRGIQKRATPPSSGAPNREEEPRLQCGGGSAEVG